jgi:hypothetical protein
MDGWFFATANWNEHEELKVLPVHPDDLNAGLVIPQYELVTVMDGRIRPLYTDPTHTGTVLSLSFEPPRKVAGFVIDAPHDENGVLKKERKLCIIRHGRVVLPALIEPPNQDWRALGQSHIPFEVHRYNIGVRRLVALVRPNWTITEEEDYFNSRAGLCRDVRIRCYYIGGYYQWIHQAKCYLEPRFLLGWGW